MSTPRNPDLNIDNVGVFTDLTTETLSSVTADSASNVTVTVDPAGSDIPGTSYTSLQDAINFFQNKTLSNCVIDVAAGTYSFTSALQIKNLNENGDPSDLIIRGDYLRDMAGYTFIDSANIGMNNRQSYTSTIFGAQGATIALAGTAGAATISVTPNSGAIDFVTAGVVAGDVFEVKYNGIADTVQLTVLSTTADTLTFTTNLTANVSDSGTSISLWPNRILSVASDTKVVEIFANCTLDGFAIDGNSESDDGIIAQGCDIIINHFLFSQNDKAVTATCASINAGVGQSNISRSITIVDSDSSFQSTGGVIVMRGAQIIKTNVEVDSGYLRLSQTTISNSVSILAHSDGTIEFDNLYSQSNSGLIRAYNTGQLIISGLFINESTASVILTSQEDGDVMVASMFVFNSSNVQFMIDSGGSINAITSASVPSYGIDYWDVRAGGVFTMDYSVLDDFIMDNRTGFTSGGIVMRGRGVMITLDNVVVPTYTANANANQAFSLKPFDLKTGVNILFTEAFSDLTLVNSVAGPEAFEYGIGSTIAVAGALTGTMEDILIGLAQNFTASPGTTSRRAVVKAEGQLVSGGGSVYINFGTAAGATFNTHTFDATGTVVLHGYLV
jgi:hypothetical protein